MSQFITSDDNLLKILAFAAFVCQMLSSKCRETIKKIFIFIPDIDLYSPPDLVLKA